MKTFLTTTAIALLMSTGVAFAQSGSSPTAATDDDCKAQFSRSDMQSSEYDTVRTDVDANKDGQISEEEYVVACKEGIFAKVMKGTGGESTGSGG